MNPGSGTSVLVSEPTKAGRKVVRRAKKFSESGSSPRRKSLQMLQPVAGSNQTKLVGSDGFIRLTNQPSRTPKRKSTCDGRSQPKKVFRSDGGKGFTIFEDKSSSSKESSSQQKSSGNDVVDMLTSETPTEKYWEEMAETRRVALEETLKENEQLHMENSRLKEENERLKVMADQAEYLADVVETLIGKRSSSRESDGEDGEEDEASSAQLGEDDEENQSSDQTRSDSGCNDDVFDDVGKGSEEEVV